MEARLSQRRAAAALTVSGDRLSHADEDSSVLSLSTPLSVKASLVIGAYASPEAW